MAPQSPDPTSPHSIEAALTYCIDTGVKPVNETMGPEDLSRKFTGALDDHPISIANGRPMRDRFELERHGFIFVDHHTAMRDFYDVEELKSVYYPEAEALVRAETGANRVVIFDHTLRSGDDAERQARRLREPVTRIHNDFTDWSGPQRLRDILPDEADALLAHRFAIIQVWRATHAPIQSHPLALCDARTLAPGDLIKSERRYPDRVGETYQVAYNPDHRWFYFPEMTRDEALVFKVYDTQTDGRARFTAHTSFVDPSSPAGAPPRQSIEMRMLAMFSE